MKLSNEELLELRARALQADITGIHLANAASHLVTLVDEVLELRKGPPKMTAKGEMTVSKAAPKDPPAEEAPPTPSKTEADDIAERVDAALAAKAAEEAKRAAAEEAKKKAAEEKKAAELKKAADKAAKEAELKKAADAKKAAEGGLPFRVEGPDERLLRLGPENPIWNQPALVLELHDSGLRFRPHLPVRPRRSNVESERHKRPLNVDHRFENSNLRASGFPSC